MWGVSTVEASPVVFRAIVGPIGEVEGKLLFLLSIWVFDDGGGAVHVYDACSIASPLSAIVGMVKAANKSYILNNKNHTSRKH